MAPPSRTEVLNTFAVSTAENRRPGLIDNFFTSASLWAKLRAQDSVTLEGGRDIREHYIYAQFPASSYGRGSVFDTSTREFGTDLVFDWKFSYAPINLDEIDIDLNDSPQRVFSLMDAAMQTGELSLIEDLSVQLFADGSGNSGKDIDGLASAVSQSGTYGEITRSGTVGDGTPGSQIQAGGEDSTGGTLTLTAMNTNFSNAIVAREKPNLIVTTQTLWNRIWERSQPSERNQPADLREIGFEVVRFNNADVTIDSHCPSGTVYLLNTKFIILYVKRGRDFRLRGPMFPTNQERLIHQLLWAGNMVVTSPRLQAVMTGVT